MHGIANYHTAGLTSKLIEVSVSTTGKTRKRMHFSSNNIIIWLVDGDACAAYKTMQARWIMELNFQVSTKTPTDD